jgi:general secretion pathway protein A
MFLSYYGLREQPFGVTPDARFLYLSASHHEALALLCYGILNGRGFLGLIAPPGMGKTTLLAYLLESLRESARTAFLVQSQCDSREFLRFLLADLGVSSGDGDMVRLQHELNEVLIHELNAGRRVVIVIDEAQGYDNTVLETIRMLSNFESPRAELMQIVLAGQPQLADRLASDDLVQLRQRISILCRLTPLTASETTEYISHRLRLAGYTGPPLFAPEALAMISLHSGGIPRNINNLCFQALTLGFAKSQKIIDAAILVEALAHLDLDSIGMEAVAKGSSSNGSKPLPAVISPSAKEERGEAAQGPSAASAGTKDLNPADPEMDKFFPSEATMHAQAVARERGKRRPFATSSDAMRIVEGSGRRTGRIPRVVPANLFTGLSKIGRAVGSLRNPHFDRRFVLVSCTAIISLLAGAAGWHLSVHALSAAANHSDILTADEVLPQPTVAAPSPTPESEQPARPREVAPETSEPHTQPAEATLPRRSESIFRRNTVQSKAASSNGPVLSGGAASAPVSKANQIQAENLPLSKQLGTDSWTTAISSISPAPSGTKTSGSAGAENAASIPPRRIGGESDPPKLISSMPPIYPAQAKQARVEGDVTIRAEIDTSGRVGNMTIMPGSPMLLQDAALQALRTWKYQPAKLDGQPVTANVTVTMKFREGANEPPAQHAAAGSTNSRPLKKTLGSLACRAARRPSFLGCSDAPPHAGSSASETGQPKP